MYQFLITDFTSSLIDLSLILTVIIRNANIKRKMLCFFYLI